MRTAILIVMLVGGCVAIDEERTAAEENTQSVASLCGDPPGVYPIALDLAVVGSGSGYYMTPDQWSELTLQLRAEADWRTCVLTIGLAERGPEGK